MAVVVVVDLSVDTAALLIPSLLVGPLIAALGATFRQTVLVSAIAVVVSVPLGANTDAFGSDRYFVATGVLLVGGALAILIARLRAQLEPNRSGADPPGGRRRRPVGGRGIRSAPPWRAISRSEGCSAGAASAGSSTGCSKRFDRGRAARS